jgi:ankyrin repeat protein
MNNGSTPLNMALQEEHLAVARCLFKELGADVNQAATDGVTPLLLAACKCQLAIMWCLVKDFGADVNKARQD